MDVAGRGILAVTGPLRIKFLHNIVSNDLQSRGPGQGTLAAVMDVKGRLLVLMRALVTEDAVLLEMPADRLDVIEPLLVHYKRGGTGAISRGAAVAVLGSARSGRGGDARPRGATAPADAARESHFAAVIGGAPVRIVRASDFPPADGPSTTAPPEPAADGTGRADRRAAPSRSPRPRLDALRVEDGWPWYGRDVTEDNLLHETGLVGEYHSRQGLLTWGRKSSPAWKRAAPTSTRSCAGCGWRRPLAAGAPCARREKTIGAVTTAGVSPRLGADRHGLRASIAQTKSEARSKWKDAVPWWRPCPWSSAGSGTRRRAREAGSAASAP